MEVSGKRSFCEQGSKEIIEITCKPCEDEGTYTAASGWCRECEENMCKTCFGHHRKAKVCKDHALTDLAESTGLMDKRADEGLERCPDHLNELIKFHCPDHDQVGCGDCMILEHKMCKVEYIPNKAKEFKDSQDLDSFVKDISNCNIQIEQCLSDMQTKRSHAEEMHVKFIADAEAFKNELLEHVNKLTNEICSQAVGMKSENIKFVDELEKDITDIARDMSTVNETYEEQRNHPNKLFVSTIRLKQKIKAFNQQIEEIKSKNKIKEYTFQRDSQLEHAVMTCRILGHIQSLAGDGDEIVVIKTEGGQLHTEKPPTKQPTTDEPSPQPLLDQRLRSENIVVDGDILSFSNSNQDKNGLYIGNIIMERGSYFEVEIIKCGGSDGSVGIGLVPKDYPKKAFPGWHRSSAGYHSDDGRIFIESGYIGTPTGSPCSDNDRMGCGLLIKTSFDVKVFFTRNGKKIGEKTLRTDRSLYPAIALDTFGQKVKVTLAASMPAQ